MEAAIFVPLIFFSFLGAIIIVPVMAKERTKRSAHDLIARALDRGQQLDPTLVQQLSSNMLQETDRPRKSLGNAVVLLALAGAFVGVAYVTGGFGFGDHEGALVPAVLLGSLGAAFLFLAIIDYASKKRTA